MTTTMTPPSEEDRYRIKLGVHAVLDAILDAKTTLPNSPYSCSATQLQLHTELTQAHDHMMRALYLTNQVD